MALMRRGYHKVLEEEANLILRRGADSHPTDPTLILTPAKEALRRRKEILVTSGVPDPSLRRGVYGRSINATLTHLNSRDGVAPPVRVGSRSTATSSRSASGLADFVENHLS